MQAPFLFCRHSYVSISGSFPLNPVPVNTQCFLLCPISNLFWALAPPSFSPLGFPLRGAPPIAFVSELHALSHALLFAVLQRRSRSFCPLISRSFVSLRFLSQNYAVSFCAVIPVLSPSARVFLCVQEPLSQSFLSDFFSSLYMRYRCEVPFLPRIETPSLFFLQLDLVLHPPRLLRDCTICSSVRPLNALPAWVFRYHQYVFLPPFLSSALRKLRIKPATIPLILS